MAHVPFRATETTEMLVEGYGRNVAGAVYIYHRDVVALIIHYSNLYLIKLNYGIHGQHEERDELKGQWTLRYLVLDNNITLRTLSLYLEANGPFQYDYDRVSNHCRRDKSVQFAPFVHL